ncbi:hypothetical protein ES703_29478 [subsurface metagenome]
MPESAITKRPKRKASDVLHTVVKAGISAVPGVGGPANELFSLVIKPPLGKRLDKWWESISERLKEVETKVKGFKIENLSENEMFISTLMQATQVAIRNHQRQKLEALRNAVLNAALPNAPEENLQLMFLNFVDSLTLGHLRMLKLLNDFEAKRPLNRSTGVQIEFVAKSKEKTVITAQKALADLIDNQNFYDQVLKDLRIRGLLEVSMSDTANFLDKIVNAQPTNLGKQLLAFIKSPFTGHNQANSGGKAEAKE